MSIASETKAITFTLDGREVTAEAGMSIWEIANGREETFPYQNEFFFEQKSDFRRPGGSNP